MKESLAYLNNKMDKLVYSHSFKRLCETEDLVEIEDAVNESVNNMYILPYEFEEFVQKTG
jgi:uncharacterized Fe-S center protein